MEKKDILSLTSEQLCDYVKSQGEANYKGIQIFKWLHQKKIKSFNQISDIKKDFLQKLDEEFYIPRLDAVKVLKSSIDSTHKFLLSLNDKNCIEAVLMRYNHGLSICISTQVGCKMGCKFCASTKGGFIRNLTAGEILSQIYFIKEYIGERISNIVLMGIGEPLDNYDNVISFLNIINDKSGENISHRHISLSTCGKVDKIYKLADLNLQLTLSISLHAVTDEKRSESMPINNIYNIQELLKACKYYINITNRRISFEYALIKGHNDTVVDAQMLCKLLKDMLCHVNLILVNEIDEIDYKKSDMKNANKFLKILKDNNINATIRRTLGKDINAACGQLRLEKI